jgi:hypothetical protein
MPDQSPIEQMLMQMGYKFDTPPPGGGGGAGNDQQTPPDTTAFDNFVNKANGYRTDTLSPSSEIPISPWQIDTSGRFPYQRVGWDNEDLYAKGQSGLSKFGNALAKMGGTAISTAISGTIGLVQGVGDWASTGDFTKLFDNEITRQMANWQKEMENDLPNYYTKQERDAEWWSGDNLLTANFWFDKVMKNIGFALGAAAGGYAWSAALKAVRLTTSLAKAGKYLESLAVTEPAALPLLTRQSTMLKSLQDLAAKSAIPMLGKALQQSDRFLLAAFATTGEASIEAIHNMNEFRDAKIAEFTAQNGRPPQDEELDEINSLTDSVGQKTFLLNTAILGASNYIMLPKIFGSSYRAERNILTNIESQPLVRGLNGEAISRLPQSGIFRKLYQAKNIAALTFSPIESAEEAAQFVAQVGVKSYYDKKHRTGDTSFQSSLSQGLEELVNTKEGVENFLIGGISGGIMTMKSKIKERGITGYGGEREIATQSAISDINARDITAVLRDGVDAANRAITLQEQREAAIKRGDILESKDLEFDYAHNYISSRVKYGKADWVRQDIEDVRAAALTEEGFAQLQEEGKASKLDTRESFLKRTASIEAHLDTVNSLYEDYNNKYGSLYRNGERVYSPEVIDKMVYAAAKIIDYDSRILELSNEVAAKGIEVYSLNDSIAETESVDEAKINDLLKQINKLNTISAIKDDIKTQLRDFVELSLRRKQFLGEYEELKSNPEKNKDIAADITDQSVVKIKQSEKTPEGKSTFKYIDVELGKEYPLKDIFFRDGNTISFAPKIKILSKTLSGEYEVALPKGITTFIAPKNFGKYIISDKDNYNAQIETIVNDILTDVLNESGYKEVLSESPSLQEKIEFVNTLNNNLLVNKIQKKVREATAEIIEKLEKEAAERAKFQANKELQAKLFASQKSTEQTSGSIGTPPPTTSKDREGDDYARAPLYNFLSKESTYESGEMKLHQKNRNMFLLNFDDFSSDVASRIRAITVTKDNEEALGLKGIMDYALAGYTPEEGEIPILKLYIITENEQRYLVDKNGNKVSNIPLGTAQEYTNAIFGMFHEPNFGVYKFGDRKGKISYSQGTEEELKEVQKLHTAWRANVLQATKNNSFLEYEVGGISRGIPEMNYDSEGNPVDENPVVGVLTSQSSLSRQLVQVPTKENDIQVRGEGRSLNFTIGRPVFVNGNTIEPLNNRKFTVDEAKNIFKLISILSDNRNGEFSEAIISYLKGVLYWKIPTGTPGRNQIWIGQDGMLHMGSISPNEVNTVPFTKTSIEANEIAIINFLLGAYNNINNLKLKDVQKPFIELQVQNDGTIKEISHKSYQHFLLSPIYDLVDGTTNDKRQPFLTTNIRAISKDVPDDTNYRYKYSTLIGREFERPEKPKSAEIKKEAPKTQEEAPKESSMVITAAGAKFNISYIVDNNGVALVKTDEFVKFTKHLETTNSPKGGLIIDVLRTKDPEATNEQLAAAAAISLIQSQLTSQPVQPSPTVKQKKAETDEILKEAAEQDEIIKQEIERLAREAKSGKTSGWEDSQLRMVSAVENYSPANLQKEMAYIAEKTPFLTEIVNEILKTPDGIYAWGKYKNLVITLYNRAQEGTGYHEVFEGVWKAFTNSREKRIMLNEFRSRKGEFIDRTSGAKVNYKNATDFQAKEQMADEFADYILNNIKPPKARTSLIERFFRNIWNFIKSIFSDEIQSIDNLFSKIDAGYYKTAAYINIPNYETEYARDYRIGELDFTKTYQITKGVVAEVIQRFLQQNKSLVEFDEKTQHSATEMYEYVYDRLEEFYTKAIFDENVFSEIAKSESLREAYYKVWKNISANWNNVKELTNEYLKLFDIVISEEKDDDRFDAAVDDNADRTEYTKNAFRIDAKHTAAKSIKLLISTISDAAFAESTQSVSIGASPNDKTVVSVRAAETGMQQLINFTKTINNLIANLHTYNTLDEKLNKLNELRKAFPNYQKLWKRINQASGNLIYDWKLKVKFNNVFSKQKPEAVIMYVQSDGSSYSGKANLSDTIAITVQGWIDTLKQKALSGETELVKYDDNGNFFLNGTKLKQSISTLDDKLKFLSDLGISFSKSEFTTLSQSEKQNFSNAVSGLYTDVTKFSSIPIETAKTMDAVRNLSIIAESKIIAGADFDSVFPNLEGEFVQTFILPNAVSKDINYLNNSATISDLLKRMPHLQGAFAKDSYFINNVLFIDGKRTDTPLGIKYIQGIVNQTTNKTATTERLSEPYRLLQEINQNLNNNYYILLPADSATEWMIESTTPISFSELRDNPGPTWNRIYNIFETYLETEKQLFEVDGKHRLLSELSKQYTASKEEFRQALNNYVNSIASDSYNMLANYNIISKNADSTVKFHGIDKGFTTANGLKFNEMQQSEANTILKFRTINAIINNIELQKIFFGDPASYIKTGSKYENRWAELFKRIKSFLSPRESSTYGSDSFNKYLNEIANKAGDIQLSATDPGYHTSSDVIKTVTMADVITDNKELSEISKAFNKNNSTDASCWSPLPSYRELVIKSGYRWTDKHEVVYQYRMAKDRLAMEEDDVYTYSNPKLKTYDENIVEKYSFPNVYFPVLKPILSGHAETKGEFHPVLDKDSVVPLSYSSVRGTNMQVHYMKMLAQDIGYIIVESGRKVGNKGMDKFYDNEGNVNNEPYQNIVYARMEDFGIQQETAGKKFSQTRGSQLTKLAILNLIDAGKPISDEADILVGENIAILSEQANNGYNRLLDKLGIIDAGTHFFIEDNEKISKLLKNELLRREVTSNIKEALSLTDDGEFITSLEALPNYRQIKNILFSFIEKYITRPQLSGGPKVQVSGALMEKLGIQRSVVNGKIAYTSAGLRFYGKEDKKMEVLLPFYATDKLRKVGIKFKDEIELLEIINSSPDAQKILSGVGFRIPTQELNSVESFIIKGFLPEEMGDTIVVPEELTTKAGSDFDVDKLNTYLRNIYIDNRKQVRVVPYFGIGEEARRQLKSWLNQDVAEDIIINVPDSVSDDPFEGINFEEEEERAANKFEALYAQSIENGYIENLEKILALPENFSRLLQPNSSDELLSYRDKLVSIAPAEFDSKQLKSIINPLYVSQLRHMFITGKGGVGIAATQQTSNSLTQLSDVYINPIRILQLADNNERMYAADGTIKLPHNINEYGYPTLSKIHDVSKRHISDKISQYINGFVDIAKDPFVIQIGASRLLAPTYLALERLGVPSDVVVYFMNQPIIREYIKILDKNQTGFMYNADYIKEVRTKFNRGKKPIPREFPNKGLSGHFLNIIEKYYNNKSLSEAENAEQQMVLSEFLKYYTIGQNLFRFTQGLNYDTTRFNSDHILVFKELQYQDADQNNIFTTASTVLHSSFIGNVRDKLISSTQAINTVFSLKPVKYIINQIVADFRKNIDVRNTVGNLIEESYISHLIQTKLHLNNQIEHLMISNETALVNELRRIKKEVKGDLGNNILLAHLIPMINKRTTTKNIRTAIKPKDVFTKELYTEAFNELLAHPATEQFARKLARLAFLQSGVSNNILAMKDFLPLSIFSETVNAAIVHSSPEVAEEFRDLGSFYRNSWSNTSIVPQLNDELNEDMMYKYAWTHPAIKYNYAMFALPSLKREAQSKYVTITRYDEHNDYTYKFLAKRVDNTDGNPVIVTTYNEYGYPFDKIVYIPINAWGDGIKAQEYYETGQPSKFNNGYIKIENELNVNEILSILHPSENEAPPSSGAEKGGDIILIKPEGLPSIDFNKDDKSQCE